MKNYSSYMDHQTVSPHFHETLLTLDPLESPAPQKKGATYMKFGALAACAALLIGFGPKFLTPAPAVTPTPAPAIATPAPTDALPTDQPTAPNAFIAQGPADAGKLMFPMILAIDYADATDTPELAADIALPDGAFTVDLTKEDIQALFWGPEGKPAVEHFKTDPGDFPLMLMNWAGYTVTGRAIYDGSGALWELCIYGEQGEDSFTLRAAPGRIPPTCLVEEAAAVTQVNGTQVSGWYRSYDNDGDDVIEHICTSEFLAGGVGFRFTNVGSGGLKSGTDAATALGGAKLFNEMTVTQLCHADGFYLDHLAQSKAIPAWETETFQTLPQAQSSAAYERFAPYLPQTPPAGYGDFYGRYTYQEAHYDRFWLRWSKNYDDVEVDVSLPEGDSTDYIRDYLVDASIPASYDWRLYDGPISDAVPAEYQFSFYMPAFRAADMTLEIVQARMHPKDTGGENCCFYVLHDNGTVVSYNCSGVTAAYVWSLVEPTLP